MNVLSPKQRVEKMSKDERSLLLYLEARAVDHAGKVEAAHMNADDVKLARIWAAHGFIRFTRLLAAYIDGGLCFAVELTPRAWECASIERRQRAARSLHEEVKESLEHFESQRTST